MACSSKRPTCVSRALTSAAERKEQLAEPAPRSPLLPPPGGMLPGGRSVSLCGLSLFPLFRVFVRKALGLRLFSRSGSVCCICVLSRTRLYFPPQNTDHHTSAFSPITSSPSAEGAKQLLRSPSHPAAGLSFRSHSGAQPPAPATAPGPPLSAPHMVGTILLSPTSTHVVVSSTQTGAWQVAEAGE